MLLIAAMGQQNMDSFFLDRGSLIIKSVFYFPVIVTQSIYIDIKPGIFNAGRFPAPEADRQKSMILRSICWKGAE